MVTRGSVDSSWLIGDEPVTTTNLRRGAQGEAYVATGLQRRCGPQVELLFNRRLSAWGRDGDIDVLAVTPNGAHVFDVKRYPGARGRVQRHGRLVSSASEQLLVNGRHHTRSLESAQRQGDVVRGLLDQVPNGAAIPLHLAFCFVDADLPWLTERVGGVEVLGPKRVARRMNAPGPLDRDVRKTLLRHFAHRLPAA